MNDSVSTEPLQIGVLDLDTPPLPVKYAIPPPVPPRTPPPVGFSGGSEMESPGLIQTLQNMQWGRLLGEWTGAAVLGGGIGWVANRPKRGWQGFRRGAYAGTFLWSGADVVRSFSRRHWSVSLAFLTLMIPSGLLLYREIR